MSKRNEPLTEREKQIVAHLEADGHKVEAVYNASGRRSFKVVKSVGASGPMLQTAAASCVRFTDAPARLENLPVRGVPE